MANDCNAGHLRWRFSFQQRTADINGDPLGPFAEVYQCAARLQFLHGTEAVMGARLEGKQPVIITVRACDIVRGLTTADECIDLRSGQRYDVTGIEPDERRVWTDILAISKAGGTVG